MTYYGLNEEIIIPLPNAFDMKANIGYLTRRDNECMYEVQQETVTKVITMNEMNYLAKINVHENKEMKVTILGLSEHINQKQREQIINYIRDWFDLDTDLTPFYTMAKHDPLLKTVTERLYGLRLIGIPDLFEALCWGILGQQINLTFAYTLKKQFVEKFGDYIEWNDKKYWIFPSYKEIAQLTPTDLGEIKMTMRKSEYIIGIAKQMEDGVLSKDRLLSMGFQDAERTLKSIRGIGPWTANYVLMRCLRFQTAFPIDDVGLQNSIKLLCEMDRKPSKDELIELSLPWEGWQSYATFYLWRVRY